MITADRARARKFVTMKERSVPAPATPASVWVDAGMAVQFPLSKTMLLWCVEIVMKERNYAGARVGGRRVNMKKEGL